jgi:hypothetical protein
MVSDGWSLPFLFLLCPIDWDWADRADAVIGIKQS